MQKVYVLVLDYADSHCDETAVEVKGVFKSHESAVVAKKNLIETITNGESWEADAIKDWKENGDDSIYVVAETSNSFEIYEFGRYDTLHTTITINETNMED